MLYMTPHLHSFCRIKLYFQQVDIASVALVPYAESTCLPLLMPKAPTDFARWVMGPCCL